MATPKLARLRLPAADGGILAVDIRSGARPGERRPVLVICHGFKGFQRWGFFPKVAERFALGGYTAVTFNFSGSGVSGEAEAVDEPERWFRQTLTGDLADLVSVIDHFAAAGPPWIGLLGHSRGGATAVLQAARDPRIGGLVTWAAVSTFQRYSPEERERWRREGRLDVTNARTGQVLPMGLESLDDLERNAAGPLDVLGAAARIRIPWLIAHGAADESVPVAEAEALASAAQPGIARLLSVDGAGHTFGIRHPWAGTAAEFELLLRESVAFLGATLP